MGLALRAGGEADRRDDRPYRPDAASRLRFHAIGTPCAKQRDPQQNIRLAEDPFDRMVIAAARAAGHPLVTADERIGNSGLVRVLWD